MRAFLISTSVIIAILSVYAVETVSAGEPFSLKKLKLPALPYSIKLFKNQFSAPRGKPALPNVPHMPTVKPDPNIDFKILYAPIDPTIDYKILTIPKTAPGRKPGTQSESEKRGHYRFPPDLRKRPQKNIPNIQNLPPKIMKPAYPVLPGPSNR